MAKEICQLPYFVELWKCLYERQQVKYSKIEEEGHFLLLWPSKRLKGGGCKKPAHSWKIIDYCTAYFIWNCFDGSRHASGICRRCAVQTTWRPSEFGIFVGLSAPGSSILGLFTPKGQEGGGGGIDIFSNIKQPKAWKKNHILASLLMQFQTSRALRCEWEGQVLSRMRRETHTSKTWYYSRPFFAKKTHERNFAKNWRE